MILTIIVVLAILIMLILDAAGSDMIFVGGLFVLLFGGVITPEEALAGFSNKGMMTVALLFIVSQAVENTGAFNDLATRFFSVKSKLYVWQLLRLMLPVSVLSAFMNNTPIVTIFIPVVKKWAAALHIPASKLLIPLSYAAIFGGVCTLIGTSTNLVVHGLIISNGDIGFSFFELAKVGIPVAFVGFVYLAIAGKKMLPNRGDVFSEVQTNPREFITELEVSKDSILAGKSIEQAKLRNLKGVYLMDIDRNGVHLGPVTPDRRLASGDRLFFSGNTDSITDILSMEGLRSVDVETMQSDSKRIQEKMVEVVVSPEFPGIGKTIKEVNFRSMYNAAVVAVGRNGKKVHSRLGDVVLQAGDNVILLASQDFTIRNRNTKHFFIISDISDGKQVKKKGSFALAVVLLMVTVAAVGVKLPKISGNTVDMFFAAAAASMLLIIGRVITTAQARNAIRLDILVTIAAAFGVSKALTNSGAAQAIGGYFVQAMAPFGPVGALFAVYLVTSFFTEIITNNAAAALMVPIAYATSASLGVSYYPFMVAVAIGASASFATPIGYQTNLLVQSAGGYRFSDFLKIGVPMNFLAMITAIAAIVFWYDI